MAPRIATRRWKMSHAAQRSSAVGPSSRTLKGRSKIRRRLHGLAFEVHRALDKRVVVPVNWYRRRMPIVQRESATASRGTDLRPPAPRRPPPCRARLVSSSPRRESPSASIALSGGSPAGSEPPTGRRRERQLPVVKHPPSDLAPRPGATSNMPNRSASRGSQLTPKPVARQPGGRLDMVKRTPARPTHQPPKHAGRRGTSRADATSGSQYGAAPAKPDAW